MSTEVVMPQMGESLTEGTIIKWHKKPGERVERDEPLFEISTDKVDTEVPAPTTGVLERILVDEGQTVPVGTVVGQIGSGAVSQTAQESPGETTIPVPAVPTEQASPQQLPPPQAAAAQASVPPAPATKAPAPQAQAQPASSPTPVPAPQSSTPPGPPPATAPGAAAGHFRSSHEPKTFVRRGAEPTKGSTAEAAPTPPMTPPTEVAARPRNQRLSPAVVSLATRHQLPIEELMTIPGTGEGGRITKKDVARYVETRAHRSHQAAAGPRAPAPAPQMSSSPTPSVPAQTSAPPTAMQGITTPPAQYLYQPEPEDKLVPMSAMRKQIADHMIWSQQISAQVTSFTECDMHRIVRYREEQRGRFEEAEGIPLSFLPFVSEASVRALKEFPIFNASVVGDQVAFKKHIHLGIAVALDEGLIVPVIRNADEMNFVGLARAAHQLADKARTRRLTPPDVTGATFTITNPGMFGGLTGTPMLSQPQVAILGLGAVQKKPVVVDDAIAIRPVMVLALTFDHRVIDGATGFQFLERVKNLLEQFDMP